MVPRLRRLRDRKIGAKGAGRSSIGQGEGGLHLRHRMRGAFSVLHVDLRFSYHSRPRAGDRDRDEARQSRSRRVGHRRRRRCAVDRRQSPVAPSQAQCRCPVPVVQQRNLRSHQGAVFADFEARDDIALDPLWLDRFAGVGDPVRAWLRRPLRRSIGGHRPKAPARNPEARPCS